MSGVKVHVLCKRRMCNVTCVAVHIGTVAVAIARGLPRGTCAVHAMCLRDSEGDRIASGLARPDSKVHFHNQNQAGRLQCRVQRGWSCGKDMRSRQGPSSLAQSVSRMLNMDRSHACSRDTGRPNTVRRLDSTSSLLGLRFDMTTDVIGETVKAMLQWLKC